MCTVSMVGDHYRDIFKERHWYPMPTGPATNPAPLQQVWNIPVNAITREEFDALKREVEDMKKLLIRAKEYDERNNEPHCEMDEKVALLKQIAKLVGVDLSDVFPPLTPQQGDSE